MRSYLAVKNVGFFPGTYFGREGPCSGEIAHFQSRSFCWDVLTDPAFHKRIVITDRVLIDDKSPLPEESQSFMPHLSAIVFLGPIKKSVLETNGIGLKTYLEQNEIAGFIPDRKDLLYDALRFVSNTTAGLADNPDDAVNGSLMPASYQTEDLNSVSAPKEYLWDLAPGDMPAEKYTVAVWDFGTSYNLLRIFRENGCRIRVVPPSTRPEDLVALHPDGIILSGGPLSGPGARKIIPLVERIIGIRPLLGIGGGAVTLAQALGIDIVKLESPHHGSAIPVEDIRSGRVSATYQAHSLSPDIDSTEKSGCEITHLNVCDDTIEGFANREYRAVGSLYTGVYRENPHFLTEFNRLLQQPA